MSPFAPPVGPRRSPDAAPPPERRAPRLRSSAPGVPGLPGARRRRLLIAVLLAGAATPASASAATYTASAGAVAKETWTFRGAANPNPCATWTQADGTVRVRVYSRGDFAFQAVRGVGAIGGLTDPQDPEMNVSRKIDWRMHTTGRTSGCTPCGPLSEFGACEPATPDVVGNKDCRPNPGEGSVLVTFTRSTLVTAPVAPSATILRDCTVGIPHGVPLGSPEPKLLPMRFRGAAARIRRLGVGETERFRRVVEKGTGCKRRAKTEMSSCTRHEASVTIRRTE